MSEHSPNADCAVCRPEPHPYRLHIGGACAVDGCPCLTFVALAPAPTPRSCYVCGRPSHANGVCPYVSKAKHQR